MAKEENLRGSRGNKSPHLKPKDMTQINTGLLTSKTELKIPKEKSKAIKLYRKQSRITILDNTNISWRNWGKRPEAGFNVLPLFRKMT